MDIISQRESSLWGYQRVEIEVEKENKRGRRKRERRNEEESVIELNGR